MSARPVEFSTLSPFQSAAEGLAFQEHGLLHCVDDSGARFTYVTPDVAYHRMLTSASPEARGSLVIPADKYPIGRPGWPDEWRQP